VRVAAYQAPLLASESMEAIALIREQVLRCESAGVEILCSPEAVLCGLANDADRPSSLGLNVGRGELQAALEPLASATVTTIVGSRTDGSSTRRRSFTGELCSAFIASSSGHPPVGLQGR
jgi:predicted amidohydrolase